jgi:peroxiredoxin Q/BCP
MQFIVDNIWLILFVVWGIPLTWFRSRFRKMVYNTDSWIINIKPVFIREIKALFGNIYPGNRQYIHFRNYYRLYLLIYVLLFILYFSFKNKENNSKSTVMEKVSIGSQIPYFSLNDQYGKLFDILSVKGKKNLVIYFYPKDDSPGCTKQACSFRDQFDVFTEADAIIIGISSQSVESHLEFAKKHRLNYTLLSDENEKVRKLFGVPTNLFGLLPGRVTYVVNKQGVVVYMFNSQLKVQQHIDEALRILKELK